MLLVAAALLPAAGVSMTVCLVMLMFVPAVTVVGYETVEHRHQDDPPARMNG